MGPWLVTFGLLAATPGRAGDAFWRVRLRAVDCVMAAARESGW